MTRTFSQLIVLIALFIFLPTFSSPSMARDHYVDPNAAAKISGNGEANSPWRSLQRLIDDDLVKSGDRVILASGDYDPSAKMAARPWKTA